MNIITQNVAEAQFELFDMVVASTDLASTWGYEDATSDEDQCGSMYFVHGSAEWDSYNAGYLKGLLSLDNVLAARLEAAQDLVQRASTFAGYPVFWGISQEVEPC